MHAILLFVLSILLIAGTSSGNSNVRRCRDPKNVVGFCVPFNSCPKVKSELGQFGNFNHLMRKYQCGGLYRHVCCVRSKADFQTTTKRTESNKNSTKTNTISSGKSFTKDQGINDEFPRFCGENSNKLTDKIFGGSEAALREFPWIAALEYITDNKVDILCGGSLINVRYVLTAAHCVKNSLKYVRLGEHNLLSERDCSKNQKCNPAILRRKITRAIKHHKYLGIVNQRRHETLPYDIALLRLNKVVRPSLYLKPICLPQINDSPLRPPMSLTVAGWGQTGEYHNGHTFSDVLRKVDVPFVSKEVCQAVFSKKRINILPQQICAGGKLNEDSCVGDSGGPLMRQEVTKWILEGIVSFSLGCGVDGRPGVYTDVRQYLPWIYENVVNSHED